ncbi:hypothetical protein [uncultured Nostoc sp.]
MYIRLFQVPETTIFRSKRKGDRGLEVRSPLFLEDKNGNGDSKQSLE